MDNMGHGNTPNYIYSVIKNDTSFSIYYGDTVQCNSIKNQIQTDSNGQFKIEVDTNICILVRYNCKLNLFKFENGIDSIYFNDTIGPVFVAFCINPCF
jgi:hypothetical protein